MSENELTGTRLRSNAAFDDSFPSGRDLKQSEPSLPSTGRQFSDN